MGRVGLNSAKMGLSCGKLVPMGQDTMRSKLHVFLLAAAWLPLAVFGQGLSPEAQKRVDAMRELAIGWAAQPVVVAAVGAQNAAAAPEVEAMNQGAWAALDERAPLVHALSSNEVAKFLRGARTDKVTEIFVSDAKGRKVAFLAKTTNWSHLGKAKHDDPMTGKFWQGKIEVDQSAGVHQIQIAVPVLADGKPIGSLVVGIAIGGLQRD